MTELRASGHEYTIWSPEGKPVSVHLSSHVLNQLRPPQPDGKPRAVEHGGLLLGRAKQVSESWLVAVEKIEEFPIDHVRGESWTLGASDTPRLLRTIQRYAKKGPGGLEVVGWYRTHSRPGLFLDEHDFQLYRSFFGSPAQIALLVGTSGNAGIFFWEEGDVHRTHPYVTLTIPPEEPVQAGVAVTPTHAIKRGWPRWGMAIPILAGLALGLFWNPTPLKQRREVKLPANTAAPDESKSRAVFEPPPLPAPDVMTPYVPPVESDSEQTETARARAAQAAQTRPVKALTQPPRKNVVPEPRVEENPLK